MSLAMIQKVFNMTVKTTALQRLILLALADCHNEQSGKCFPSYETLAQKVGADKRSVARTLKELATRGLITRSEFRKHNGFGWEYALNIFQTDDTQTIAPLTIDERSTDEPSAPRVTSGQPNHTRLVNQTGIQQESNEKIDTTHSPALPARRRFIKPTEEEVRTFCSEHGFTEINPAQFIDYYESNGWKIGKTPMKDWEATLRNWHRRSSQDSRNNAHSHHAGPVGLILHEGESVDEHAYEL